MNDVSMPSPSPDVGFEENEEFTKALDEIQKKHMVKEVFRGRANVVIYDNNDVDVRIPKENEARKAIRLKQTKTGSLCKTSQSDKAQIKLTCCVPSDSADPAADLLEQAEALVKDLQKKKLKLPPKGKILLDEEGVKVKASVDGLKLLMEVPINDALHLNESLTNLMIRTTQCLAQQNQYLLKLMKSAQQKNSTD
ncbi:MAG: hypothetical protein IKN83_07870 [Bacteroidaceae bacterium]|nr:hypothetical protein [Bacteroidaceae bacterium]